MSHRHGDVDGDGDVDMVVSTTDVIFSNSVVLLVNNGAMAFVAVPLVTRSDVLRGLVLHDITGDGMLDVLFAGLNTGTVELLANGNTGSGLTTLSGAAVLLDTLTGALPSQLVVGDLNTDTVSDLIVLGQGVPVMTWCVVDAAVPIVVGRMWWSSHLLLLLLLLLCPVSCPGIQAQAVPRRCRQSVGEQFRCRHCSLCRLPSLWVRSKRTR